LQNIHFYCIQTRLLSITYARFLSFPTYFPCPTFSRITRHSYVPKYHHSRNIRFRARKRLISKPHSRCHNQTNSENKRSYLFIYLLSIKLIFLHKNALILQNNHFYCTQTRLLSIKLIFLHKNAFFLQYNHFYFTQTRLQA
jgi:hypothetical protein